MHRYFIIYKPYLVLSQFSASVEGQRTLKDVFDLPADVYPVGRLDRDSEGLLILTNDASLNHRLLDPSFRHEREYWVQVDGTIIETAVRQLRAGVDITVAGSRYHTLPCQVAIFETPAAVPERNPPVRFRKNIPTSWISLTLVEGKNRQVRKMTAAVGFPTLRLIRHRIGGITRGDLQPGDMVELKKESIFRNLFLL
ncbi:MAG TPA: pseudouridine synthase [Chitinophagaceae bacterium]